MLLASLVVVAFSSQALIDIIRSLNKGSLDPHSSHVALQSAISENSLAAVLNVAAKCATANKETVTALRRDVFEAHLNQEEREEAGAMEVEAIRSECAEAVGRREVENEALREQLSSLSALQASARRNAEDSKVSKERTSQGVNANSATASNVALLVVVEELRLAQGRV